MGNQTSRITTLLIVILLLGFSGLQVVAQAGEVEDLITSRLTNPVKYQVIWEDFNIAPPVGLALTQKVGWGIHGAGSAVGQVGAAPVGFGDRGEGNGTLEVFSGTTLNNETAIAPASRFGIIPAFVTRLLANRQDYILAVRISQWNANQRQYIGIEESFGFSTSVEKTFPALPRFYWDGSTWSFRAGGTVGVNIPLSVPGGGQTMEFHDLLASVEGGVLKLYVDGQLVSTTAAPIIPFLDAFPAMGVKTKLGGTSAAMGVDYYIWVTERNPMY